MPDRLRFIKKQKQKGPTGRRKRKYRDIKYPTIPLTGDDTYITTTSGDRLDTIAYSFYGDVDLWWIIASANPDVIRRDSYALKAGIQIRIPTNFQGIISDFESINK